LSETASHNVASTICQALPRGVTRSKGRAMQWMRRAADLGDNEACSRLGIDIYADRPHAREVGRVGEAAVVATSAGVMEGHDVPPDVLTGVIHCGRGDIQIQSTGSMIYV